jgi:hypothetical protein
MVMENPSCSVVVKVVNEFYVATNESKDHSPIAVDGERPELYELPFKGMQSPPWYV